MPRPLPDTFKYEAIRCAIRLPDRGRSTADTLNPRLRGTKDCLAQARFAIATELRDQGKSWPEVAGAIGYRSHTSLMERYNASKRGGAQAASNPSVRGPQDVASGQCA
jgi:hypothetical protein